jgi:hypothetical protein
LVSGAKSGAISSLKAYFNLVEYEKELIDLTEGYYSF